jgi:hypothetical protein
MSLQLALINKDKYPSDNKISINKHQMKFIDHSMKFGLILLINN